MMGFPKRKPPKKQKPPIKKTTQTPRKSQPKQWTPPFQGGKKASPGKIFGDANIIDKTPEIIQTEPTYTLPSPAKEEASIPKPEKQIRPKEQNVRKEFLRVFESLTHRWRSWEVWTDFVTMTACALSNIGDKIHYEEREQTYLQTINKYSKEEQELFPELFAFLIMALDEDPEQDFLGDIYTELGLNSKEHKQIFTPYHVAQFMAEITVNDVERQIEEKGFITVHDCCCGGGVTLIAVANVVREKLRDTGLNFQNHLLVTGQDIDYVVAMMCYIQLSLLGVAGYFKVGNSITDPMSSSDNLDNYWFTPMYFFPVWHLRRVIREFNKLNQSEETEKQGEE